MSIPEQIAKQYLIDKGYKPQKQINPDFVCETGERFEVKSLNNTNQLRFTVNQIKTLLPEDVILIVNPDDSIEEVKWKDIENVKHSMVVNSSIQLGYKTYMLMNKLKVKLIENGFSIIPEEIQDRIIVGTSNDATIYMGLLLLENIINKNDQLNK